jgi:hypothetical protein
VFENEQATIVSVMGGDKLTISLNGKVSPKESLEATDNMSITPVDSPPLSLLDLEKKQNNSLVTVTYYSCNEAGKVEQRVTGSASPKQPLSLPLTTSKESSMTSNNPFTSLMSVTSNNASPVENASWCMNPFLNPSNPFSTLNGKENVDSNEFEKKPVASD